MAGLLKSHLAGSPGCPGEAGRCSAWGRGGMAGCREQRLFPRQKAVWKRLLSRSEVLCCSVLYPCVCSPLYRQLGVSPGCSWSSSWVLLPASPPLYSPIYSAGRMDTHRGTCCHRSRAAPCSQHLPNPWGRMLGCWTTAGLRQLLSFPAGHRRGLRLSQAEGCHWKGSPHPLQFVQVLAGRFVPPGCCVPPEMTAWRAAQPRGAA